MMDNFRRAGRPARAALVLPLLGVVAAALLTGCSQDADSPKVTSAGGGSPTATVDSAAQRRGRHDWVTGVRGVARGFRQIDVVLKDLVDHDRAAARREATREDTTLLRASRKILAADRLLELRAS